MDPESWLATIEHQKQVLLTAQKRKGQKPTNKASRLALQFEFLKVVSHFSITFTDHNL